MADWKVTWIFNVGRQGWSETLYTANTSTDAFSVYEIADKYARQRMTLIAGSGANLDPPPKNPVRPYVEAVRVSEQGQFGLKNKGRLFSLADDVRGIGDTNPYFQTRNSVLFLTLSNAALSVNRRFALHGLPDAWTNLQINDRRTSNLTTPTGRRVLGAFTPLLAGGENNVPPSVWALRRRTRTEFTGATGNVNQVNVNPDGTWRIYHTYTQAGFVTQRIVIRGIRGAGLKKINGPTRIVAVGAGYVDVLKKACQHCITSLTAVTGSLWSYVYELVPIDRAFATSWGTRKLGRAFFAEPGRRGNVCCT